MHGHVIPVSICNMRSICISTQNLRRLIFNMGKNGLAALRWHFCGDIHCRKTVRKEEEGGRGRQPEVGLCIHITQSAEVKLSEKQDTPPPRAGEDDASEDAILCTRCVSVSLCRRPPVCPSFTPGSGQTVFMIYRN